jgi:hypothetical protein
MTIPKRELILQCSAVMIAGVALAAANTRGDSLTAANLTAAKKKRREYPSVSLALIFFA